MSNNGSHTNTSKKYWAFISYSSKDKKWGQWLHRRLEAFPIPKEFRETKLFDGTILGKNIKPIFRDRDELPGASELGPAILQALEQSRFLIVLCSKNSAQSTWVNKEIEDFKALNPKNSSRILTLILDGEPNASTNPRFMDTEECFPPSLRLPAEPLAGDLRKEGDGRERGFLKILAGISQLDFDRLYRRHRRVQRKKAALLGAISLAIISLLLTLSIVAWKQKNLAQTSERLASSNFANLAIQKSASLAWEGNHSESREYLKKIDPRFREWPWFFLVSRAGPESKLVARTSYVETNDSSGPRLIPRLEERNFSKIDFANFSASVDSPSPKNFQDFVKQLEKRMDKENKKLPAFATSPSTMVSFETILSLKRNGPSGVIFNESRPFDPRAAIQASTYGQIDLLAPHADGTSFYVSSSEGYISAKKEYTSSGLYKNEMLTILKLANHLPVDLEKKTNLQRAYLFEVLGTPARSRNLTNEDEVIFEGLRNFHVRHNKAIHHFEINSATQVARPLPPVRKVLPEQQNSIIQDLGRFSEEIVNVKEGLKWSSSYHGRSFSLKMEKTKDSEIVCEGYPSEVNPVFSDDELGKMVLSDLECGDWVLGSEWFITTHWNQKKWIEISEKFNGEPIASIQLPDGIGWPEWLRRSRQRPLLSPDGKYLYVHYTLIDANSFETLFSLPFGTAISPDWRYVVEPLGNGAVILHKVLGCEADKKDFESLTSKESLLCEQYDLGTKELSRFTQIPEKELRLWSEQRNFPAEN